MTLSIRKGQLNYRLQVFVIGYGGGWHGSIVKWRRSRWRCCQELIEKVSKPDLKAGNVDSIHDGRGMRKDLEGKGDNYLGQKIISFVNFTFNSRGETVHRNSNKMHARARARTHTHARAHSHARARALAHTNKQATKHVHTNAYIHIFENTTALRQRKRRGSWRPT